MGRIASDASFPGKCDHGAAGDADRVHGPAEGDSIHEPPGQGGCENAGCIRRIDVALDSVALNDSLL